MKIVRDILEAKGYQVWTIPPDSTVYQAIERMAEKGIGALLVGEPVALVGIISERDYARKVILMGKHSKETRVEEIMTRHVLCVGPEETLERCMGIMTEKRVRHLPVMEKDRVVGVISSGDVLKAMVAEKDSLIEELEDYIIGRR